jgi:hypothetical protein
MSHASNHDETGKLDLVPMIDCVMLLLLFFILTSSFRSEEQHIASLLSTEGGPGEGNPVLQPDIVRIVVLPGEGRNARVRIGGGEELTLDDATLAQPGGPAVEAAVDAFHAALAAKLEVYEKGGARTEQTPIEIHCATRLPWRDAIVVYDAVRAYEQARLPDPSVALSDQRSVAFGAPTVRRTATDNETDELERLERLR